MKNKTIVYPVVDGGWYVRGHKTKEECLIEIEESDPGITEWLKHEEIKVRHTRVRLTPCLPNSLGASEGWDFVYIEESTPKRGNFEATYINY